MIRPRGHLVLVSAVVAATVCTAVLIGAEGVPAADAIRAAVRARMGEDAVVTIKSIGIAGDGLKVKEARPDPSARLGRPVRFTLITANGAALPVQVDLTVEVPHAVVKQPVLRAHVIEATQVEEVTGVVVDTPLTRLVTRAEAVGARALRPLAPGTVMLPAHVAARRIVEPGDAVTVVAMAGAIEVTATFTAVDGGRIGDVIRVKNPDTRKFIRGRIVKAGIVEVIP